MSIIQLRKSTVFPIVILFFLLLIEFSSSLTAEPLQTNVKIAVRSHSGKEIAINKWSATADYLSRAVEGYSFEMVPLVDFEQMRQAILNEDVDFVLTNPAAYIELEAKFGATRIVTLINRRGKDATEKFGGVIFTGSGRKEIKNLNDIRGRSIMGVHREAFGGWWMALCFLAIPVTHRLQEKTEDLI